MDSYGTGLRYALLSMEDKQGIWELVDNSVGTTNILTYHFSPISTIPFGLILVPSIVVVVLVWIATRYLNFNSLLTFRERLLLGEAFSNRIIPRSVGGGFQVSIVRGRGAIYANHP